MTERIKYKGQIYVRQDASVNSSTKIAELKGVADTLYQAMILLHRASANYRSAMDSSSTVVDRGLDIANLEADVHQCCSIIKNRIKNGVYDK